MVGTGAGGGPAAAALAEAGLRVVVLESGERLEAPDFTGVEGDMFFRLGRFATTRDGSLNLYAGHCVGGSTVVNDALCWRTPPEVLAGWRAHHGVALSRERLDPFLDRAWADVGAVVMGRDHLNRNAHALELGAARLGWAAERAGARVLAGTRATAVLHEAGRATGVRAERDGRALTVQAPIVCLAAGVLGTPVLLRASGLRAGPGLQFHSSVHVTARFAEPIHGYFGPTMAYAVSQFADVLGHDGPGFMIENTAVHPLVTAQNLPGFGAGHERAMEALPYLAKAVVVLRDEARGTVEPGGPAGDGRFEYALTPRDLARMARGMRETARAYLAAGAEEVWLPVDGVAPVRDEGELAALEGRTWSQAELFSLYAVHLFGGAAMGGSRALGFCDSAGESFEVEGLHVVDAAALPGNTGANPQITIMANALRIAAGIVERRGRA